MDIEARLNPEGRRTGHRGTRLAIVLTLMLGQLGCAGAIAQESGDSAARIAERPAELMFDQYVVITGSTERQTVLTGFLLDGALADLVVVTLDAKDDRHLHLYRHDESTWTKTLAATLGSEVVFVDVAEIGGRDRLITYEPGRLNWFDPKSATERPLVAARSNFSPPRADEIPHVDVSQDVNGDGRDDLVVPEADGFLVFVQTNSGTFENPVKIGPAPDLGGIYGADGYRYDPWSRSRIYEIDFNHDGRVDLAYWNDDHFEVHLQVEDGRFVPETRTFTTTVAFDSDDLYSLAAGDMAGRVLHSLADLNGDGVTDLVVFSLSGKSISDKRSAYEVHFGSPTADGGIAFAADMSIWFQSEDRIQLRLDRHDFDQDGQTDLMLTTIHTRFLERSLWKEIKGAMGDDVWLELEFYRMEDGVFSDEPNAIRRLALDGSPSHREPGWVPLDLVLRGGTHESRKTPNRWPRSFNTNSFVGDVTGDGRADLLIESSFRDLLVFTGVRGPNLFAERPVSISVLLPNDREYSWQADLNKDGKQDILLHQPYTLRDIHGAPVHPPGTEPHRLTVLIAR